MTKNIQSTLLALVALTGLGLIAPADACDKDMKSEASTTIKSSTGPGVTEYRYSSAYELVPTTTTNTVIIEKPVVVEKCTNTNTKIIERQVIIRDRSSGRRRVAHKPRRHRVAHFRSNRTNRIANRVTTIEKTITKPVLVEKVVEKPIIVERPVIVDRMVEKPVFVDRLIEKPVYVDRVIEKQVQVETPVVIEKPVVVYKKKKHLLDFSLF